MSRGTHYSYVNNNPLSRIDRSGFDDTDVYVLPDLYSYGTRIVGDFGSGLGAVGSAIESAFRSAWDWLTGSGGGSQRSANQVDAQHHEINLSSPLQSVTQGATQPTDGNNFHYALSASGSTLGPQVVGNPSPYAFDPSSIGSSLGSLSGGIEDSLAQSQSYVCGPCAQPGAQPDPSQQMLPQITVTAQNPYSLSPVTTTAVYIGFGSVVGGGSGTTQLFRAVSPAELASIKGLGTFTNPPGIESKYFSTSLSGAQSYAAQAEAAFGDEPYSFVQTSIPNSQITPEMVPVGGVDGGIETVVVPTETLPVLEPPVIIELP